MPPTIRPIRPDELAAWFEAFGTAFYIWADRPAGARRGVRRPTHRPRPGDRRLRGRHDRRDVPDLRRPSSRCPGGARVPVERGLGGERPADPPAARDAQPDDRATTSRGRRRAAMSRRILIAVGVADLRPVRLRPGDVAGELDAPRRGRRRSRSSRSARVEIVEPAAARAAPAGASTTAYAAGQPGEIDRPDHRWDFDLGLVESPGPAEVARPDRDPSRRRGRAGRLRPVPRRGELGRHGIPDHVMLARRAPRRDARGRDRPLAAPGPDGPDGDDQGRDPARATSRCSGSSPTPRAAQVSGPTDFLWVRLARRRAGARRARATSATATLVLEVDRRRSTAGRARRPAATGSRCATARRRASGPTPTPDLTIDVAAARRGVPRRDAARRRDAGRGGATEHRAGALARGRRPAPDRRRRRGARPGSRSARLGAGGRRRVARLEVERRGVHAVAQAGRARAVREDVAEVRAAGRAGRLDAAHPERCCPRASRRARARSRRRSSASPSRTRTSCPSRTAASRQTTQRYVPVVVVVPVHAGEGALGLALLGDRVLEWAELARGEPRDRWCSCANHARTCVAAVTRARRRPLSGGRSAPARRSAAAPDQQVRDGEVSGSIALDDPVARERRADLGLGHPARAVRARRVLREAQQVEHAAAARPPRRGSPRRSAGRRSAKVWKQPTSMTVRYGGVEPLDLGRARARRRRGTPPTGRAARAFARARSIAELGDVDAGDLEAHRRRPGARAHRSRSRCRGPAPSSSPASARRAIAGCGRPMSHGARLCW